MYLTGRPPASENCPPAYSSPRYTARALTTGYGPPTPGRGVQRVPSHAAIPDAAAPSAIVKVPAAISLPSKTVRANTLLLKPPPSGRHPDPSQLATPPAATFPTCLNHPAATSSSPYLQ